ncbi:MAG TPA: NAD(P)/FAD-dependent oxidoreductase [Polyangiaceae bacterium]|nr:NAD(P)/FAD-dependent oxidoreductase [Polyangiaceae bacterium]
MSEVARYDVCVIGAGPAGFAAAVRAHDLGKRVLLVERRRVGGAGVEWGALSSKTLWHLSNDYALACRTDRGFRAREIEVRFRDVAATVQAAVSERRELMTRQLACLGEPGPGGGVVHLRYGAARFLSPHAVEIAPEGGGRPERHEAERFVVATGSRPRVPAGIEVDGERVMTSDQIEGLADFPESLVIVGAGVIGCEYATIFGNFGRTRAFLIDRQPRILPFEDDDVAAVVAANFARMGVTVHRESTLGSLRAAGGAVEYVLKGPGAPPGPLRVERALVAVGRVPNVEGLGLEAAGVALAAGGGVAVEGTRTGAPHIYAVGDVTPDLSLVNVAELEGRHAVELMYGLNPPPIHYEALSAIMFLSPEVASVGLNETQARQRGVPYRCGVVSNRLIGRNVAMRQTGGFIKLLAAREGGRLLGLRVVGPQASAAAQGVAFLIEQGATLEAIDHCVHPHPAITEGVQECARLMLGKSVFKPAVFGPELLRVGEG